MQGEVMKDVVGFEGIDERGLRDIGKNPVYIGGFSGEPVSQRPSTFRKGHEQRGRKSNN